MSAHESNDGLSPAEPPRGLLARWHTTPLYLRILGALALGALVGVWQGPKAAPLQEISSLILQLLKALAIPLILFAVIHALLKAQVGGNLARRMVYFLATNTMVAIFIGLLVANLLQPGVSAHGHLEVPSEQLKADYEPWKEFKSKVPDGLVKPLVDNNVVAVIIIALTFGIALRKVREQQIRAGQTGYLTVEDVVETAFQALMTALHWIIDIIPFAVFGVVASVVGVKGFGAFQSLAAFVGAVLLALLLQATFYITRVRLGSWVRPGRFLRGGTEALMTAFGTASSTATMPVTYTCLKEKVGVREESASMGALVGSNFNNDGTALYEAMGPLFIAQALDLNLSLSQQVTVALMSVVASVGAPGIPEAGLITMVLVFKSVHLPDQYVPLFLTVDWFLDRCRTAVNVMGDMSVACLLDGKQPPEELSQEAKEETPAS